MRHVWGAGTLTLGGGSFLQLLVNSVWRVRKRISEIDAGGQIQHGAKWIQAEISYQSMHDDYTFNYLKIFNVERYLGVGQYCVTRNKFISSDRWNSFQKNLRKAYIVWLLITGVFKFLKMVHCSSWSKFWRLSWAKISKFFHGGIWKKIFGEINSDGLWMLYLQGILLSLNLCHVLKIDICEFAKWYFAILELWLPGVSVIGG